MTLVPVLTPRFHLLLAEADEPPAVDPAVGARLRDAFAGDTGAGLLQLGAGEVATVLPPALAYWRDFAQRFVTALCTQPEIAAGEPRIEYKGKGRRPRGNRPLFHSQFSLLNSASTTF